MIKKILAIMFIAQLFVTPVFAEETDIYQKQYEQAVGEQLSNGLPYETERFLDNNGLNPENEGWVYNITPKNVFLHIFSFLKSGLKGPFVSSLSILAIILVSALISSNTIAQGVNDSVLYATVICTAAVICGPVFSTVQAAVSAMKGCAVFMTSFIPIFAVVVASSGAAATAVSMSSLLLGAAQVVSYISNFAVMPLMSGYLSISLAASVSPVVQKSGVADGIKKLSFWIMSLLTTIFIGILSIQTAVSSSADTLTVKTAKFLIGSSVPIAGTALSEALTTVTASVGILKASVGIYGIVASVVLFLPLVTELFLWRIGLTLTASVADLFAVEKIPHLLRSADSVLSVLIGIILLTLALFVISLAVILTVGKVQ